MTFELERIGHRALALGMLLVLVLAGYTMVITPIRDAFAAHAEERSQSRHRLANLQGLIDNAGNLRTLLGQIDAHPIWQRLYAGDSSAASEADLMKELRSIAEAQGITLDTVQPLEPTLASGFEKLGAQIGFSTTIDHFSRFLLALDAAPHSLRLERLYVASPMSQTNAANPFLTVRADAVGYRHPAQPGAPS